MTVNHWVPGSSPGRGAKFKASVHTGAFLWPWDSHLGLHPRLFGPRASPLRGRAEARSAAQSSPGRGAKFKASVHTGRFLGHRTPPRGFLPGYSAQGPHPFGAALKRVLLRSRVLVAEPNSKPRFIPGLFCGHGTLTWDYVPGYSAQGPHPFGAALKRALLRSRVLVAEPNLKA